MKPDDNFQEAKSQWIKKMLQKIAVLPLILYTRIKREDIRAYMKFIGDRLGTWGKQSGEISGIG